MRFTIACNQSDCVNKKYPLPVYVKQHLFQEESDLLIL